MSDPESIPPVSKLLKVGHWHPELLTCDTNESALHAQSFNEQLHVGVVKQWTYIPTSVRVTAFVINESPSAESVTSVFSIRIQTNIYQFVLSGVLQSAT
jgi:hypothetical protein